jgi:hypothetical protein
MRVDPLADRFAWVSPFNYAENRVPNGIDLWGLQVLITTVYEVQKEIQSNGYEKFSLNQLGPTGVKDVDYGKGYMNHNVFFFEGKQYNSLNEVPGYRNYRQRQVEKTRRIFKNTGVIVGGVLTVAAIPITGGGSLALGEALLQGFVYTSGVFAISSGSARLTLELADKPELADQVPGGIINATVGLVIKSQVEDKEVVQTIDATLSIMEGIATFNFTPTSSVQSADNLMNALNNAESVEVVIKKLEDLNSGEGNKN